MILSELQQIRILSVLDSLLQLYTLYALCTLYFCRFIITELVRDTLFDHEGQRLIPSQVNGRGTFETFSVNGRGKYIFLEELQTGY